MKHYTTITVEQEQLTGTTCDGCGAKEDWYGFTAVSISVHADEEGGAVDCFDYCDTCLIKRKDALKAAGSTATLVTGEWS